MHLESKAVSKRTAHHDINRKSRNILVRESREIHFKDPRRCRA